MKDNYCYYYMYMTVEITTLKYQARVINKDIDINFFFFFFFFSDHFIQNPCYIITLCRPGELHRGPCGLHNSFDQGKYQNE